MKLAIACALTALVGCAATDEGTASQSLTQPAGQCGTLETHVFGIYAAPHGEATVHISRPGKHAIVLSAHEATRWKVTADPGVTIEGIYAVGIHRQTVVGPTGVKVVSESKDDGGPYACGFAWASIDGACNTEQLMKLVGKRVHTPNSFHGCYEATGFAVGKNMAVTSDCNQVMGEQNDFVEHCDGKDSCGGPIFL